MGLETLRAEIGRDFARINHPPANWPISVIGPGGEKALDVLVIGGGQFGQTAAFALIRDGVRNIRVVDRAPAGQEGPWATTARMLTLRSPKHLAGPDLGIPSLTFRAWYEARHGASGWEALYKIDRLDWVAYLLWLRDVADVPIENETSALDIQPEGGSLLRVRLQKKGQPVETVYARQVVLATGRNGYGGPSLPSFPSLPSPSPASPSPASDSSPSGRLFHTDDAIDFQRFRGGRIAVLGAGASAFDNAASALEAGAGATLFCRRRHLPQVNLTKAMGFSGFLRGFSLLDDATRWDMLTRLIDEAAPPPHESVLRCERFDGFQLRLGTAWQDVRADEDGVTLVMDTGPERYDAVIFATGFTLDIARQPLLAAVRHAALLWRDRVPEAQARRYPDLARHPYLARGYALTDATGQCPEIGRIRLFGSAAAVSYGVLAGDIPLLSPGAIHLSQAITDTLFLEEAHAHRDAVFAFEDPELKPTPYFVGREDRDRRGLREDAQPATLERLGASSRS